MQLQQSQAAAHGNRSALQHLEEQPGVQSEVQQQQATAAKQPNSSQSDAEVELNPLQAELQYLQQQQDDVNDAPSKDVYTGHGEAAFQLEQCLAEAISGADVKQAKLQACQKQLTEVGRQLAAAESRIASLSQEMQSVSERHTTEVCKPTSTASAAFQAPLQQAAILSWTPLRRGWQISQASTKRSFRPSCRGTQLRWKASKAGPPLQKRHQRPTWQLIRASMPRMLRSMSRRLTLSKTPMRLRSNSCNSRLSLGLKSWRQSPRKLQEAEEARGRSSAALHPAGG